MSVQANIVPVCILYIPVYIYTTISVEHRYMFASASPDNLKQWKCPEGSFIQNLSGHNAIVNCLAVNPEGVLVSGADNGTLYCWDWRTGYNFQRLQVSMIRQTFIVSSNIVTLCAPVTGSNKR